MEKNIKPVGARCWVEKYKNAEKSESGLIMDTTASNKTAPVRATVLRAGTTSQFKEGDELLFRRYSVDELKVMTEKGEMEITLVEDEDVVAVFEKT